MSQLAEFFGLMGQKKFWEGRHDLALLCLLRLYLKVKDKTEREENLLEAALIEYNSRFFWMSTKK